MTSATIDDVIEAGDMPARAEAARMSLSEALDLWVKITGVEPRDHGAFTYADYKVNELHQEIQEALELDPTEITGRLLLSFIAQEYFEDRSFTVDELMNDPARVAEYLGKTSRLANFLRGPDVAGVADEFAQRLLTALQRYDADRGEVREIVEHRGSHGDLGVLAVLRRDALRTIENLQVHQFLDGETEPAGATPAYGKFLYRWDNINSMLRAMVTAPSGVTVNMIQSPKNPYGVHFVFAIRNGGRLFVFTDKEQVPHPLAEGMWRRPDKILAARAERNWFPYDLAGLKFDEEGRAYIETATGKSLVQYQNRAMPIKPLSELSPPQVIWLAMMLDLIVEKFWRQSFKAKELSFTGEMIRVKTPLIEAARAANLPVVFDQAAVLESQPITLADVRTDAVADEAVGDRGDQRHRWLEERYRHLVVEEALDQVGTVAEGTKLMVRFEGDSDDDEEEVPTPAASSTPKPVLEIVKTHDARGFAVRVGGTEVQQLDPASFGTREELQRDRLFLARTNYAAQIDRLAQAEYDRRSKEVMAWVRDRVIDNLPNLTGFLVSDGLLVKTEYQGESFCERAQGWAEAGRRQFVEHKEVEEYKKRGYMYLLTHGPLALYRTPYKSGMPACFFSGAPSAAALRLIPETAEQLAYLCGVQVPDLPDVLQNWTQYRPYKGNAILDRVDPLQWVVSDPWCELKFVVNLFVSKREMSRLEKAAKASDWVWPDFVIPTGQAPGSRGRLSV